MYKKKTNYIHTHLNINNEIKNRKWLLKYYIFEFKSLNQDNVELFW